MALEGLQIAFIGAGNMATAIATGLVGRGVHPAAAMRAASPSGGGQALRSLGVACSTSNAEAVANAHVVVLCVKPHIVDRALASCLHALRTDGELTVISVAAGTTMGHIAYELNRSDGQPGRRDWRVVRVMPNTPCSIGMGASAFCANEHATERDVARVRAIFSAVGVLESVTEPQLDAVTGLSGSGPAFAFMFIEALADGGVAAGLPRSVAMALAAQTVRGAAGMVQETGRHPGVLKDAVASPGGTTIAGIHALESAGFRGAVMSAVTAAAARSRELGGGGGGGGGAAPARR